MKILKKILCKLGIHLPIFVCDNFTDTVSGKMVKDYKCCECNKIWMATTKYSTFKSYKDKTVLALDKEYYGLQKLN